MDLSIQDIFLEKTLLLPTGSSKLGVRVDGWISPKSYLRVINKQTVDRIKACEQHCLQV